MANITLRFLFHFYLVGYPNPLVKTSFCIIRILKLYNEYCIRVLICILLRQQQLFANKFIYLDIISTLYEFGYQNLCGFFSITSSYVPYKFISVYTCFKWYRNWKIKATKNTFSKLLNVSPMTFQSAHSKAL